MKSYETITNNLLKRRDRYVAVQKRRRDQIIGTASALCCGLLLFFGIGVFSKDSALIGGETSAPLPSSAVSEDRIIIHSINNLTADRLLLDLKEEDYIEISREELIEYYGVDYIPDVPNDMKPWPNEESGGVFKRNGGIGEVYWDQNLLNFSSDDFKRNVHLEVRKNGFPLLDYLHFKENDKTSVISGTEVLIGLTESGYYYARFMYQDVGFVLDANGVSQDEFISIIRSLLD